MFWLFLQLFAAVPGFFSASLAGIDKHDGSDVNLTSVRRNLLAYQALSAVFFVGFVAGFPQPGDMREIDDSSLARMVLFAMMGVLIGVAAVWSPHYAAIYRRGPFSENAVGALVAEQTSSMAPALVQGQLSGMVLLASVRGFEQSPIGAEYHWWLFAFAIAQLIWLAQEFSRRRNPRVFALGWVTLAISVAVFLLQPLRFLPAY